MLQLWRVGLQLVVHLDWVLLAKHQVTDRLGHAAHPRLFATLRARARAPAQGTSVVRVRGGSEGGGGEGGGGEGGGGGGDGDGGGGDGDGGALGG